MLSKSSGQISRVSASMHVLFSVEGDELPDTISNLALDCAIDFVEVCCQHTAYNITGRGNIDEHLCILDAGKHLHALQI